LARDRLLELADTLGADSNLARMSLYPDLHERGKRALSLLTAMVQGQPRQVQIEIHRELGEFLSKS
jgi:hypothetical protein